MMSNAAIEILITISGIFAIAGLLLATIKPGEPSKKDYSAFGKNNPFADESEVDPTK